MGRTILLLKRCVFIFPMIRAPRDLLQMLMQGAAKDYVQFLESPADAQYRYSGIDGGLHQRKGRAITQFVLQNTIPRRRATITMRRDIRVRPGEEQAIDA